MKKALKLLLAFTLMATAIFTAVPAFADDNGDDDYITTTLEPWKTLRTNTGTSFPGETFNFALYRIALTDPSTSGTNAAVIEDGDDNIVFAANPPTATTGSPVAGALGNWRSLGSADILLPDGGIPTLPYPEADGGGVYAEGRSADMLADLEWTFAGIYAFRLREVVPATNPRVNTPNDSITETTQFATNEYEVHVQIGIDADRDFYVQGVAVFRIVEGARGPKVNPDRNVVGDGNFGVNFTNDFVRTVNNIPGEPPCDPADEDCEEYLPPLCPPGTYPDCPELPNHVGLRVSKLVDGPGSSSAHVFTFTGTLTLPAVTIGTAPTSFVAEVWENDGTAAIATVTFVPGTVAGTFVPAGDDAEFTLTGAQHLRLPALPVGTQFNFVETDRLHYTDTNVNLWLGGPAWGSTSFPATATLITTGDQLIVDTTTHAAFVNILDARPITGIITNNMPLILTGVAILGFVGMAAANKKRRAYE